jgi:hypothetical protein
VSTEEKETVSLCEAKREIAVTSRRIALLHLSYAKTLVKELGERKGRELIAKAIKDYGIRIGEKTRKEVLAQGLEPTPENFSAGTSLRIPKFGMHDYIETAEVNREKRWRAYGCVLGKLWREYGEENLGRLYCYVDVAKYMAYNPRFKLMHVQCVPEGHEYCELAVRPTTEKEVKDFQAEDKDWLYIDK